MQTSHRASLRLSGTLSDPPIARSVETPQNRAIYGIFTGILSSRRDDAEVRTVFGVAFDTPVEQGSRGQTVKPEAQRNIVHRQRFKLKLGRSEVVLESKTTVPVNEAGESYVASSPVPQGGLAPFTSPHFQAWGPLLLQMGYKGFGRALSQINTRGFAHALTRERILSLRLGHHALVAAGFVIEAWQMAQAVRRSVAQRSARPATAQAARSLTTWGAVWAGVELFGTGGAMLGIPLGPAVVVTTAIGATVGGCVGFFAGDWVARQIEIGREEAAEN